jgi:hypothetical protein
MPDASRCAVGFGELAEVIGDVFGGRIRQRANHDRQRADVVD